MMNDNDNFRLNGRIEEVRTGVKYERYEDAEQEIEVGDMAYHLDPDAGCHASGCELVQKAEYIGYVTGIYYKSERDEVTVTTTSSGHAPPEHYTIMNHTDSHPMAEAFENSEYDKWMGCKWHYGKHGVPEDTFQTLGGPDCNYCTGKNGKQEIVGM